MSGEIVGYRSGYLNGEQILEELDKIFLLGSVRNPSEQIQPAGIDLTLKRVLKPLPVDVEIPFDESDWIFLRPGGYWIEFNERVAYSEYTLYLYPRSTLFRVGCTLAEGIYKKVDSQDKNPGAFLLVVNPYGVWLEKGARISQAVVFSHKKIFWEDHCLMSDASEGLTIEKVSTYIRAGKLGIKERETEVVEETDNSFVVSEKNGCLLRFKETIQVASNELILSLNECKTELLPGLRIIGAVVDPGYSGRLHACLYSIVYSLPIWILKRFDFLRLLKSLITPVSKEFLYNGRYQEPKKCDSDQAEVKWLSQRRA